MSATAAAGHILVASPRLRNRAAHLTVTTSLSPALSALRESTRDQHVALEGRLLLGSPDAGRAQYAGHVAAMWGWLQPLESLLWHQHAWPAFIEPDARAGKSGWLHTDILAARADGFLKATPELCEHPDDLGDSARRFGWAYVIEGSMLGGQVLHRRLAGRLRPWPMRYLQGYGAEGGRRWREFLGALAAEVRTPRQVQAASDGAVQAFRSINLWLQRQGAA